MKIETSKKSVQGTRACQDEQALRVVAVVSSKDLDHYDALTILRDRLSGLRCAINGASVSEAPDRNGLQQLMEDIIGRFEELRVGFALERGVKVHER